MASVSSSSKQSDRRQYANKPNKVINGAEVRLIAFEATNEEGVAGVGLMLAFGKDPKDGKPHIAIMPPRAVEKSLIEPFPWLRDQLRALLQRLDTSGSADSLPEDALDDVELGNVEGVV